MSTSLKGGQKDKGGGGGGGELVRKGEEGLHGYMCVEGEGGGWYLIILLMSSSLAHLELVTGSRTVPPPGPPSMTDTVSSERR